MIRKNYCRTKKLLNSSPYYCGAKIFRKWTFSKSVKEGTV